MAEFNEKGEHVPDPRPVEWPTGLRRPLSIQDEIKRFIRHELSMKARDEGIETFQEADDFDTAEDPDLLLPTAYELSEEQAGRDASDLSKPEPPATSLQTPAEGRATPGAGDARSGASAPATSVSGGQVALPHTPPPSDAS